LAELIVQHVDIENDLTINKGPLDVLDHAATKLGFGSKIGVDATTKFDDEIFHQNKIQNEKLTPIEFSEIIKEQNHVLVEKRIPVLCISADYKESFKSIIEELKNKPPIQNYKAIFLLDNEVVDKELSVIFWILLNNIDPIRDCKIINVENNSILVIDGRRKTSQSENFTRDWPNIIVSDKETIKKVDEKWETYKIGKFIPSPSLKFHNLLFGNDAQAFD